MMMFKFLVLAASIALSVVVPTVAQSAQVAPALPALEWLLTYNADFGFPDDMGQGPSGRRVIFPLQGGKFNGPKLQGRLCILCYRMHSANYKAGKMHNLGGDWATVRDR
jgi:hypothetical protein